MNHYEHKQAQAEYARLHALSRRMQVNLRLLEQIPTRDRAAIKALLSEILDIRSKMRDVKRLLVRQKR